MLQIYDLLNVFHNTVISFINGPQNLRCVFHAEHALLACVWRLADLLRQLAFPQLGPPAQHAVMLWMLTAVSGYSCNKITTAVRGMQERVRVSRCPSTANPRPSSCSHEYLSGSRAEAEADPCDAMLRMHGSTAAAKAWTLPLTLHDSPVALSLTGVYILRLPCSQNLFSAAGGGT